MVRIIRLSVAESDLLRNCKGTPRTDAQADKKERHKTGQLIYLIKVVPGKICLGASQIRRKKHQAATERGSGGRQTERQGEL